jgi:hypothetical protein
MIELSKMSGTSREIGAEMTGWLYVIGWIDQRQGNSPEIVKERIVMIVNVGPLVFSSLCQASVEGKIITLLLLTRFEDGGVWQEWVQKCENYISPQTSLVIRWFVKTG